LLNAVAATAEAEGAAVSTVEAVEASIAVEEAVQVRIAAAENHVVAPMKARDPMAEAVTVEAPDRKLAAVSAHPERNRPVSVRRMSVPRMFVPPLTMASGIRSAIPLALRAVPHKVPKKVRRVPVRDAIPGAWRTPT